MSEDLLGTEVRQKSIDDRQKRLRERAISDTKKEWSTAEGRRLMMAIIRATGRFTRVPTDRDAFLRERKIGRWEVGEEILRTAEEVCPDLLALAKREAANDKLLREQEIKNEGDKFNAD